MFKNLEKGSAALASWDAFDSNTEEPVGKKRNIALEEPPEQKQQLLSTAIVAQFIDPQKSDSSQQLSALLQTSEAAALVNAADELAQSRNISSQEAMIDIIKLVKQLDSAWSNVLLREGLKNFGIK